MSRTGRAPIIDSALALLAVASAWPTLLYPFGRDQGLYYYVGREWALRGRIPYRDVFDHKTPGIYALHFVLVKIFGEELWPIRIAEIAATLVIGFAAAQAVRPRGEPYRAGVGGVAALASALFYFGCFDFRETAEGEIWAALFAVLAAAALTRVARPAVAGAVAGAALAMALLMKPSALWFVPALAVHAMAMKVIPASPRGLLESRGRALLLVGAAGLGTAAVLGAVIAYFGAHGALPAAIDIVVRANAAYVKLEPAVREPSDMFWLSLGFWDAVQPTGILLLLAVVALVVGRRRAPGRLGPTVSAVVFLVCAWGSVASQRKFFMGHWGVVVGPVAMIVAGAVQAALARWRGWRPLVVAAVLTSLFLASGPRLKRYSIVHSRSREYALGAIDRERYLALFVEHAVCAESYENEQVASAIVRHSSYDDPVLVRGFQPQIYARAKRHWPGRFFWTIFLVSPTRPYKQAEWREEDQRDIERTPPKVVVTVRVAQGMEGPDFWKARGYRVVEETYDMVILVRP